MYAIDFEYDGQYLSDYGFIVCHFDFSGGANIESAGSKITFEKVSRLGGKRFSLTSARYDECITATFDICKNPDTHEKEELEISNEEYRDLIRWLNRKEFLKFQVLNDKEEDIEPCYYNVSFNVEKIKVAETLFGLRLTLESDSPFGYGDMITTKFQFNNINTQKILIDKSDEIGYIYPDMRIICNQAGDLTIHNDYEDCTMVIKNCRLGEVITIKGNEQIISTSITDHDICNDFNWEFFKIGNTFDNRINTISVSKLCYMEIFYCPIIKDTP